MSTSFLESPERYEKDVIRYKNKYNSYKFNTNDGLVKSVLKEFGYDIADLRLLLSSNNNDLQVLVESISRRLPMVVGNISSIVYTGVIGGLLSMCGIDYDVHISFVLPVKVNDYSVYNYKVVNYMYISGNNGVDYHYFNSSTDSSKFTFIRDEVLEEV